MTLSLYSTYKAWRRDVAAEKQVAAGDMPNGTSTGLYSTLALFGMGVGGIAGGGDAVIADNG